ncbi:MAG: SDR family NAD(P)-dependent oxidoreductase [Bacteroidales bacterium]
MQRRVALITGGTKGIGFAVAKRMARDSFDLILTYSTDSVLASNVASQLEGEFSCRVWVLRADSSDLDSIEDTVSSIRQLGVKLDVILFNAGLTSRTPFGEIIKEDWSRVFNANLHYPVFFLQESIGLLRSGASVMFTGSLMGIHPHSLSLAYGVSKASVHALVRNLVKFLEPYKIRVNCVVPGFVDTEWQKSKPSEIRSSIELKVAEHRFCDPNELTDAYMLLVNNSYMNGEMIVVDGGYSYK